MSIELKRSGDRIEEANTKRLKTEESPFDLLSNEILSNIFTILFNDIESTELTKTKKTLSLVCKLWNNVSLQPIQDIYKKEYIRCIQNTSILSYANIQEIKKWPSFEQRTIASIVNDFVNLVILDLSDSPITDQDLETIDGSKLKSLQVLVLRRCEQLQTPRFHSLATLEELMLSDCPELIELNTKTLDSLKKVTLSRCQKYINFNIHPLINSSPLIEKIIDPHGNYIYCIPLALRSVQLLTWN